LKFLKSKVAAAAIFEKSKNHDISLAVGAISTKFGTVMQFDPLERSNRYKFKNFKIHDCCGRHTKKLKNRHIAGIRTHSRS